MAPQALAEPIEIVVVGYRRPSAARSRSASKPPRPASPAGKVSRSLIRSPRRVLPHSHSRHVRKVVRSRPRALPGRDGKRWLQTLEHGEMPNVERCQL